MLRLVVYLLGIVALAAGFSWLADRPGQISFAWEGYEGEITVFRAVVIGAVLLGLFMFTWSLLRTIWFGPAELGRYFFRRRQKRGLDALSSGMIAIGAGDKANAMRYAIQARKTLPNEPLTHLLRAQAAQLSGDKATSRRIFEAMLATPDTEQLGLRGLFLEAQREGEVEAARQFAERAMSLNPRLGWSAEALFDLQCKQHDWAGALTSLASAKKFGHVEKQLADRRRAVLLTAQAQALEDSDADKALTLALEAHGLAPGLVPAAAIAGRILASRGNVSKAAKVIQKTWLKTPHPDLAAAYAYARVGDSPRDRLDRVRQLAALTTNSIEGPIALARTAIEARDFDAARHALDPFLDERMTQRVATLMARIEADNSGDKGRVREWLARAAHAQRDPVWTADGVVSETWAPISPVTGQLDAFEWRVLESMPSAEGVLLAQQMEEIATLAAPADAITGRAVEVTATSEAAPQAAAPVTQPVAAAPLAPVKEKAVVAAEVVEADIVTAPAPAKAAAGAATATPTAGATVATAPAVVVAAAAAKAEPPAKAVVEAAAKPAVAVQPLPHTATAALAKSTTINVSPASAGDANVVTAPPVAVSAPAAVAAKLQTNGSGDGGAGAASAKPKAPVTEPSQYVAPAKPSSAPVASGTTSPASAPATVQGKKTEAKVKTEPAIFISPRAPDDPGPESDEAPEPGLPRQRYGTTR